MITVQRIYPVLYTPDVTKSSTFYIDHFDFEPTFTSDWYVSLRHRQNPACELAFLAIDHSTIPDGAGKEASKLLLNNEVDDAATEASRLAGAGVTIVQELRDEPFGQRHLIVAAPDDVLVDVIEEIPPAPEFAAQFAITTEG